MRVGTGWCAGGPSKLRLLALTTGVQPFLCQTHKHLLHASLPLAARNMARLNESHAVALLHARAQDK